MRVNHIKSLTVEGLEGKINEIRERDCIIVDIKTRELNNSYLALVITQG